MTEEMNSTIKIMSNITDSLFSNMNELLTDDEQEQFIKELGRKLAEKRFDFYNKG